MSSRSARPHASGFTIVELLIVIVIIGILAGITIVAYSGITARAHAAAAQSDASNVGQLLSLAYGSNNAYPADLSTINNGQPLSTSDGTSYSYHPGSGNASYCVTVTNGTTSYVVKDTASTPTAGGCPGDGVNGASAITNLATNPSFESDSAGWNTNGTTTIATTTSQHYVGSHALQITTTGTTNVGVAYGTSQLTAGQTYTWSGYIYLPAAFGSGLRACAWGSAMSSLTCGAYVTGTGSWQRATVTFTPSSTNTATMYFYDGNSQPVTGSVAYVDGVMLAQGSTLPTYADGNTTNWIWNGTPNDSTSTGPAQ